MLMQLFDGQHYLPFTAARATLMAAILPAVWAARAAMLSAISLDPIAWCLVGCVLVNCYGRNDL